MKIELEIEVDEQEQRQAWVFLKEMLEIYVEAGDE